MLSLGSCVAKAASAGRRFCWLLIVAGAIACATNSQAQPASPLVLERRQATVSLEPYAPNIIRVTLSLDKEQALAAPGYGFIARPAPDEWKHEPNAAGDDVYRSPRSVVTVGANKSPGPAHLPTQVDIGKYFTGSAPGVHIAINTTEGRKLVEMVGWAMAVPNHKDGNAGILNDKRPSDLPFFQVGADFVSPSDEHY